MGTETCPWMRTHPDLILPTTIANCREIPGVPKGIRTPVLTVKGSCPRPLDDGDYGPFFAGLPPLKKACANHSTATVAGSRKKAPHRQIQRACCARLVG